jgi:hypothetical protein
MPSPPTSPSTDQPVLKLRRPDEVLTAVPYLLGFHPERSLVVLGMHGPRRRVGVTMRVDLDLDPDELARVVVRALENDADDEAFVLLYDPVEGRNDRGSPGLTLVHKLRRDMRTAGIRLRDAYRIADGRWWSYLCRNSRCCPPGGAPVPSPEASGSSVVAATAVHAGLTALPDREALRKTLEPPAPWTRAASEQALERMGDELAERLAAAGTAGVRDEFLDRIRALVLRFEDRTAELTGEEAATVAVALHSIPVRDRVITWTIGERADALQRLLVEVVRSVGPPENVPVATVLAWSAYLKGNGGLANVALEIVFATAPEYSLALLVDHALQNGVPPELLRRSTEAAVDELADDSDVAGGWTPARSGGGQVTRRTGPDDLASSG